MMATDEARRSEPGFAWVLVPLLRGWMAVAAILLVTWAAVLASGLARGHRYRAEAQLSAASTARALPVSSGLAASLLGGGGAGGGVQLTPALLVRLARMDGVLYRLGTQAATPDSTRLVDRLARKPVSDGNVARTMRRFIAAQFEIQTGVMTVAVSHQDSALARVVLGAVVREVGAAFRNAARAQAREIREAQQVRVDSAQRWLRAAEESLSSFLARNRAVNPYTPEFVQLQALQREVETANTMYTQALSDRDVALGKELEETPAVVMLAAPPATLPREPRGLGVRLVMVTIVVVVLTWVLLLALDRMRRALAAPTPAVAEVWEAAVAVPVLGSLLRRLVGPARAAS
jgi:uncharacterized protein involved in exopolysaccharide biosynthesis